MLLKMNEGQVVSSLLHCLCTLQSESLQLMYKVQYLGVPWHSIWHWDLWIDGPGPVHSILRELSCATLLKMLHLYQQMQAPLSI